MKSYLIAGTIPALCFALLLASCNVATLQDAATPTPADAKGLQTSNLWEPMDSFNSGAWNKANWSNGGMFNCGFLPDHVNFSGGVMNIRLDNYSSSGKPYSSGEYRTNNTFSYGKFEANLKAAKGNGLVSSFFTYTGSPWDEIDVEILGKNTNQVQFNYFTNGQGGHEKVVNLGFDASAGFHKYMIQWGQGYINWYVEDRKSVV